MLVSDSVASSCVQVRAALCLCLPYFDVSEQARCACLSLQLLSAPEKSGLLAEVDRNRLRLEIVGVFMIDTSACSVLQNNLLLLCVFNPNLLRTSTPHCCCSVLNRCLIN